jgi:hypothetical protein
MATKRPSYETIANELTQLLADLEQIRDDNEDENGVLEPVQQAQVRAAIKEVSSAQALFVCIQDQAPYRF